MAGKKQNRALMWKKLLRNVDLDEPTSFLDHEYWGCTQSECKPSETIVEQHREMLNHVFLLEHLTNYQGGKKKKTVAKTVAWSYDMEGRVRTRR